MPYTPVSEIGSPDICIVAGDGVVYNLHMLHLRLGSTLFRDMFAVASCAAPTNGLPTVTVIESSMQLDSLLPFLYYDQPFDMLEHPYEELLAHVKLAIKYGIVRAIENGLYALMSDKWWVSHALPIRCLINAFRFHYKTKALQLYTLAHQNGFDKLAAATLPYAYTAELYILPLIQKLPFSPCPQHSRHARTRLRHWSNRDRCAGQL